MGKIRALWIVLGLIFLIVFNVVFFTAAVFVFTVSTWISYGFIHFAYFMLLLTPSLVRKGRSSAVFGFSLYSISAAYFLIALAIGIIFIAGSPWGHIAALLVQLCIAGLYGIILIFNMIANEHTANAEENRQVQIAYVKETSAKLKKLLDTVTDKEAKRAVERVYDAVYSSPVRSHPDLTQIENTILLSIYELEDNISTGNKEKTIAAASSILAAVNERNMRLKTLN